MVWYLILCEKRVNYGVLRYVSMSDSWMAFQDRYFIIEAGIGMEICFMGYFNILSRVEVDAVKRLEVEVGTVTPISKSQYCSSRWTKLIAAWLCRRYRTGHARPR